MDLDSGASRLFKPLLLNPITWGGRTATQKRREGLQLLGAAGKSGAYDKSFTALRLGDFVLSLIDNAQPNQLVIWPRPRSQRAAAAARDPFDYPDTVLLQLIALDPESKVCPYIPPSRPALHSYRCLNVAVPLRSQEVTWVWWQRQNPSAKTMHHSIAAPLTGAASRGLASLAR